MTPPVKRRLFMVSCALFGLSGSLYLIFDGLRDNLVFFYSPTELKTKTVHARQKVRVGGRVKPGSVVWAQGQRISFTLTDETTDVRVEYVGIPPDLFREGQGAVAEGFVHPSGGFQALTLLTKHDENYRPPTGSQGIMDSRTLKED